MLRCATLRLAVSRILGFLLIGDLARAQEQPAPTVLLIPIVTGNMLLTDSEGRTLYTRAGDQEGISNCLDSCLTAWPLFLVGVAPITPDGLYGNLGGIDRGDGTWQVMLDNWP